MFSRRSVATIAAMIMVLVGLAAMPLAAADTTSLLNAYLPLALAPVAPTATPIPAFTPTPLPSAPTAIPPTPTRDPSRCAAEYPTVCIPPPPPDLDCKDIPYRRFTVRPPDRHRFDSDGNGIGCESN